MKKNGFGKPIVGGGYIKAEAGKIMYLDPASGHYKPNSDQFLLSLCYFHTQGVLHENVVAHDTFSQKKYTIQDIALINRDEILARYKELS